MARVEIRGLVKRYGPVTAVDRIDLDINDGEFVVLLGPSGCGKTTTLRCIAGLEDITEGTISIAGRVVSEPQRSLPPERREIGMVFQSYAIWPHMTVAQNVAFGLNLKKMPAADVAERTRATLDLVGLDGFDNRYVSQLSGGQQQRVALARAVALQPRILLFDEPLSNLDAKLRERMRFELRQLQTRLGITSIYVTHDQQEAMVVADRVVLMRSGVIDQISSAVDLYRKPKTLFGAEFVGLANVMRGKVLAKEGATATVELSANVKLECEGTGLSKGDLVDVVCRPEEVEVHSNPITGTNVFAGTLRTSFFLGNISDLMINVRDIELRVQLSPPRLWLSGQPLFVKIPPSSLVILRRGSESP